jgi:transporter family protein
MYITYALLGAIMASLGTIFAKLGLKGVDPNLLTAIRGIVMAGIVTAAALSFGKFSFVALQTLNSKQWLFVVLSATGGALSWIFFYQALAVGPTVTVTVIDKLSIVLTAILAFVVLSESVTIQVWLGLALVFFGTLLVSVPLEKMKEYLGF